MQDISFVSESYSQRKPKDYDLSISIRRDGFSFLILYKKEVKAYSYISVPAKNRIEGLKNLLNQDILKNVFATVSIILVNQRFTLVPKKFFDDSLIDSYAELNFKKRNDESVITYESEKCSVVVLFPIENAVWSLCRAAFKEQEIVSYVPQVAPLLEANYKIRKEKLVISVENNFITAVFVKEKNLRFCNSFAFSNVNDFLYYIMNICNNLHLDVLSIPIELSGKISRKSPYFSALQMFVKNVEISENTDYPQDFPYMLFYNHCNVLLCE